MKKLSFLGPWVVALLFLAGCQSTSQTQPLSERYSPAGPVIAAIEADIEANRLTRPTGNNAMEKIDRFALIAPDDPRIKGYRDQVVSKLVSLGQQAFMQGQKYRAKVLALRALEVAPNNADAGYILDAVRESERPVKSRVLVTEKVQIEEVEAPASVGIITVTVPDLQGAVIETGKPLTNAE